MHAYRELKGQHLELLHEGGIIPKPETGLLSNTRKWIVRGDTCSDKARDFIGKGHLGGKQYGKVGEGNPGEQLCHMACSLGFYGDGITFLVVLSQSFWLRVLPGSAHLVQPNGCQRKGFWEVVGHVVSPFDLSGTLPVGGGLLVLGFLPGPPVIKQLM